MSWTTPPFLSPSALRPRPGAANPEEPVSYKDDDDDDNDDSCPGYIRGCAALVVIGLLFDFFGTFLTGLGLRSTDPNKKYKYYRVAIYALVVARKKPVNREELYCMKKTDCIYSDCPDPGRYHLSSPVLKGSGKR